MVGAALMVAMLWRIDDSFDPEAKAQKMLNARNAYFHCVLSSAEAMFRGSDTPELEQAISKACMNELNTFTDLISFATTPEGHARDRAKMASQAGPIVHAAVQAVEKCAKKDAANRRATCSPEVEFESSFPT
jgi:hypothetical protein